MGFNGEDLSILILLLEVCCLNSFSSSLYLSLQQNGTSMWQALQTCASAMEGHGRFQEGRRQGSDGFLF